MRRVIVRASEYVPVSYGEKPRQGDDAESPSVDFERTPVLYLPDGRALVRPLGFVGPER
jgi:hypothetical protein